MKLAIIGFQEFNQEMYPHLYEVIDLLKKYFVVEYYGRDDRGLSLYLVSRAFHWKYRAILKLPINIIRLIFVINGLRAFVQNSKAGTFLCVDDHAYFWACLFAKRDTKVILWSHDIFASSSEWGSSFLIKKLVSANYLFLQKQKFSSLIIQSPEREKLFLKNARETNRLQSMYLPVSIFKHTTKGLSECQSPPQLLQLSPSEIKATPILLEEYKKSNPGFIIKLHGHIPDVIRVYAKRTASIEISGLSSSLDLLREKINSCDIGFLSYINHNDENFQLMRYAFGQLVEFLACGKPVIVYDHQDTGEFIEMYGAGIFIKDIHDIHHAIKTIAENYKEYSERSAQLFDDFFDIDLYSEKLVSFIQKD